uniref:sialate O-acetylesterase n=1 Tax=uncultured Microbulbifer sp. TaxID=348147 RepID=UPI0025D0FB3D
WADAGEAVRVDFRGEHYQTEASDSGDWSITLENLPQGGPYSMTIRGENTIALDDILVGDVWLCSGQSNMEYPVSRIAFHYAEEFAQVDNPLIRQFKVPQGYDFKAPQADISAGAWLPATANNIQDFSAVGYFFAAQIQRDEQVPIGLINSSLGGSPAEAWLSEAALKRFPTHLEEKHRFASDELIEDIQRADSTRIDQWYAMAASKDTGWKEDKPLWHGADLATEDWHSMPVPGYWADNAEMDGDAEPLNGVVWFRKEITLPESFAAQPGLLELGRIVDADTTYVNGHKVGNTTYLYPRRRYQVPAGLLRAGKNTIAIRIVNERGRGGFVQDKPYRLTVSGDTVDLSGDWQYRVGTAMPTLAGQTFVRWKPGGLYNAMLHPLHNYALKGVLWYQGESNVGRAQEYQTLFPALIEDWRSHWKRATGNERLPLLFVQLANFLEPSEEPQESAWAELREAQASALQLPDTAMTVAIDIGEWNDIHPLDKKTVGQRLALAARKQVYGREDIVASGPRFAAASFDNNRVLLSFAHTNGGLHAGVPADPASKGKNKDTKGSQSLQGFAIAGDDGKFVRARAEIHGEQVTVWSETIPSPRAVRYAWADNPIDANLYNGAGLPAAPFRTQQPKPGTIVPAKTSLKQ